MTRSLTLARVGETMFPPRQTPFFLSVWGNLPVPPHPLHITGRRADR